MVNLVQKGYKKISPFFIPYAITNMGGALLAIDQVRDVPARVLRGVDEASMCTGARPCWGSWLPGDLCRWLRRCSKWGCP